MQIVSLELANTKSYHSARIDFAHGVNAIVGHNGAGKSTILEAIGFVLFDALEYKQEEFVREGADCADIVVNFQSSVDGRQYQVTRRCGSSAQYRVFDPQLQTKLYEGKADVLRFMRQHMGVDAAFDLPILFRDAVGVPQGAFTAVFLEPAAKRKITFDRLLRVEEYSRAADRLREPAKVLTERKQKLEVQIATLAARLEQLPRLTVAILQRAEQLQTATAQTVAAEQQLSKLQAKRTTLEGLQQQVLALRNRQTQQTQVQLNLETQLRAAEHGQHQAEAARSAVQVNQDGYARYQAAQAQQRELEAQVQQRHQLEMQRADLDKALALSQSELDLLLRELEEIATAEQTMAALAGALQQQATLEQTLLEAQRESVRLEDAQRQVVKQEQELSRLQGRLSTLTTQLARATELEVVLQGTETQIGRHRDAIDTLKESLSTCRSTAELLKKQNGALADITTATCPVCNQPLSEDERTNLMTRNEQRLTELRAEFKQYSDQIKVNETALLKQQEALQNVQQQMRRLPRPDEVEQVQSELSTLEATLAATKSQVAQLATTPRQIEELQAQLTALGNPRQHHAVATATAQRRPRAEEKRLRLEDKRSTDQAQLAVCTQALTQYTTLDAKVAAVRTALRDHERAYQTVLTNQQLADTVEARAAEVANLQMLKAATQAELHRIATELAGVERQFDEGEFQQTLAEEYNLRSHLGGLQTQITMLCQDQARDEAEQAALQRQQSELESAQAQKQAIEEQANTLDAMRDLLKRAGPQVTKALIQQVSSSADQIFCDIMQDYTRRLIWNEDYGITIEANGYERQFAQLSGGEQMSAALALRLALLREMSAIDIAFFDEPTTNLDETRRDSLVRQILEVKGFRQLFVISHDDAFEQATQNLIRVRRVNGISEISHQ
jgi:DNA repair protein SbcC/Rad50